MDENIWLRGTETNWFWHVCTCRNNLRITLFRDSYGVSLVVTTHPSFLCRLKSRLVKTVLISIPAQPVSNLVLIQSLLILSSILQSPKPLAEIYSPTPPRLPPLAGDGVLIAVGFVCPQCSAFMTLQSSSITHILHQSSLIPICYYGSVWSACRTALPVWTGSHKVSSRNDINYKVPILAVAGGVL